MATISPFVTMFSTLCNKYAFIYKCFFILCTKWFQSRLLHVCWRLDRVKRRILKELKNIMSNFSFPTLFLKAVRFRCNRKCLQVVKGAKFSTWDKYVSTIICEQRISWLDCAELQSVDRFRVTWPIYKHQRIRSTKLLRTHTRTSLIQNKYIHALRQAVF